MIDELYEVETSPAGDIPAGAPETKAETDHRILFELVREGAQHLRTAGGLIFEAIQRGASASQICEAFGVEPDFLETLHQCMVRRMLGFLAGNIQAIDFHIEQERQKQRELEELAAKLDSGDLDIELYETLSSRGY